MIFYEKKIISGLFEKGHHVGINFIKIKIKIQYIYKLKLKLKLIYK